MATMTLEAGGVEMSFADWGFGMEQAECTFANMQMDVFSLAVPGARVEDDPLLTFEEAVIIRRNRTGSGTSYTGGSIEFRGKVLPHVLDGRPEFEGVIYQAGGPWYDLEQTPYQQSFQSWSGTGTGTVTETLSDLVLFYKVTGPGTETVLNSGQQIQDILQRLLDVYATNSDPAPYQIGTIDPAVNVPTYQVKDITCAEALRLSMRTSPDGVIWFDYSFSPPKIHVRKRANLTGVSLAIGNGTNHKSMMLKPRYDLQPRAVVVKFQVTNSVDGNSWRTVVVQKYPSSGPDDGRNVVIQTVDLQGFVISNLYGEIAVSQVLANGTAPQRLAWWALKKPELADTLRITDVTIEDCTVTDESGTAVSLGSFPNELVDGGIADWMYYSGAQVVGKRCILKAKLAYNEKAVDHTTELYRNASKELAVHLTLTNGVSGIYSAVGSVLASEVVPEGMAQAVYQSLSELQYEGTDVRVESEVSGLLGMGNVLNLTGGRTEWTTMNAMVQTCRRHYGRGITETGIGPIAHLSAADLTQLYLINRNRRVWINPALLSTGRSSASSLTLGKNAPKENTSHGLEQKKKTAVMDSFEDESLMIIRKDATSKEFVMELLDGPGGSPVTDEPNVSAAFADLASAGNKQVKFREWDVCVGGVTKKAMFLSTDAYDA